MNNLDRDKLLNLFSTDFLKNRFETQGTKENIRVTEARIIDQGDLEDCFRDNFEACKHHAYVLESEHDVSDLGTFMIANTRSRPQESHHATNTRFFLAPAACFSQIYP